MTRLFIIGYSTTRARIMCRFLRTCLTDLFEYIGCGKVAVEFLKIELSIL